MTISSRDVKGITILDLNGRLVLGEGTTVLRDTVRDILAKGQKRVLINCQHVPYIDSSGLGELTTCFTSARRQDADLKLVNLSPKVHGLLQITKLNTIFEVFDNEAAALGSFSK